MTVHSSDGFDTPEFEARLAELDPYPFLKDVRDRHAVWYSGQWHGWQVFRYAEAREVLFDHKTFSSVLPLQEPEHPLSSTISFLDPPAHSRLRKLVAHTFAPRRIEVLAPRIQEIVQNLLGLVEHSDRMDVIADLAAPLPVLVIAELLGIPAEDQERFREWAEQQMMIDSVRELHFIPEMQAYFQEIMVKRVANPHGLISVLVSASGGDERPLSEQELLGFCQLLLVGGIETTRHLIGNALLCFDRDPQEPSALGHLRRRPDLLLSAIEEVLRYLPPFPATRRVAMQDVHLGGVDIGKGDIVTVRIDSANRDERVFAEAERFQIERFSNQQAANHLSFGQGIHFCIGAPLARLEARIALGQLLSRFELRRDHTVPIERVDGLLVYGVKQLFFNISNERG